MAVPGAYAGTGVLRRSALRLPRRKAPDRYRPRALPEWRVQAFFATVDRARERKTRGTRPGPVDEFRRVLEERSR